MFFKGFLTFCSLSIYSLNSFIGRSIVFNFNEVPLIRSFSLSLMDPGFDVVCTVSSPNPRPPKFSPVLPSRSFIVLHFAFRFIVHRELIFLKGVSILSRFILFHVIKRLSFLHRNAFAPLSNFG